MQQEWYISSAFFSVLIIQVLLMLVMLLLMLAEEVCVLPQTTHRNNKWYVETLFQQLLFYKVKNLSTLNNNMQFKTHLVVEFPHRWTQESVSCYSLKQNIKTKNQKKAIFTI